MLIEKLTDLHKVAHAMAKEAHAGQFYAGRSYFVAHILEVEAELIRQMPLTLYRVADQMKARIVALLHDIVEDSAITLEDIEVTFGEEIATSVGYLTKNRKMSYETYILRVKEDRIATLVKRADATCNLRQSMISGQPGRVQKYLDVLQALAG